MKPYRTTLALAALSAALVAFTAGCGSTANGELAAFTGNAPNAQNGQALGRFPGGPGGPGGPPGFGPPPGGPMLARLLNLTDEQEDQADDIHDAARDDIKVLRRAARDQIRSLLTDEQKAKLDEIRNNPPQPGAGQGPPQPGENPLDRLAQDLGLTDDQKSQIADIHDATRSQIESRHDQERDEFRAILTEAQLAKLDDFESHMPHPPGN